MEKTAFSNGFTGQNGAYLLELLLNKCYDAHGINRRSSLFNSDRIEHIYQDPYENNLTFPLHFGDLTDTTCLIGIIQEVQPDERYKLGAMRNVAVSFSVPEYTANPDGIGDLSILEALKMFGLTKKTKHYKPAPVSYTGWYRKYRKKQEHLFTTAALRRLLKCIHSVLLLTNAKPITCFR